ncbi:MAG TPA: alpha/beta hydrolase [Anaerolineae bacterium]|nr:alpha/beta hydrolase [Anaerolineae bacterium]
MAATPLTLHTLTLGAERLVYATCGSPAAPPLLLVHGWMGAMGDWRLLLPTLAETHFCILPDLLGHGDSDKSADGDYSIAAQARRVLAVADDVGATQFALCGHSMGGMIALTLAAKLALARVTRVVNLAGIAHLRSPFLRGGVWLMRRAGFLLTAGFRIARRLARRRWGAWLLTAGIFHNWPRPEGYIETNLRYAIQPGMEIAFERGLAAVLAMELLPHLADVHCPVLTVFGRQDRLVSPQQGPWVAARVRNHRLHWIERCGHYLMLENPQECLAVIQPFLAE